MQQVTVSVVFHALCMHCGNVFELPGSESPLRFCSRRCWRAYYTQRWPQVCGCCGQTFWRLLVGATAFCSKACELQWLVDQVQPPADVQVTTGARYYGPNWSQQRRAARERDLFCCRRCGASEELLGYELHVHHRQPFRSFGYVPGKNDYYLQANRLANLISLCAACHPKLETHAA